MEPRAFLCSVILTGCMLFAGACGGSSAGAPAHGDAPPVEDGLRPSSELTSGCFGWPQVDFSEEHKASVAPGLATGERAIDFVLQAPDGPPVRLRDLLETRPVLLVLGAYT